MTLRVVHVSHSDLAGGAARAAFRLHRSLVAAGVDSRMLVADKQGFDDDVIRYWPTTRAHRVMRRWLGPSVKRLSRLPGDSFVSLNLLPSGILRAAEALSPDVVHLHWIGFETASIAEIGRARLPLVWTLHDLWTFAGANHYPPDEPSAVWRAGAGGAGDWRERWTWRRKQRAWRRTPFNFITPSRWLAGLLSESALFSGRAASVIPHALDLGRYRPCARVPAREALGLPPDRPLIGFGAVGGLLDPRKGGGHLLEALRQLPAAVQQRRPLLCIFGQDRPRAVPDAGAAEIRWLGPVHDERLMPLAYSAFDVMVVPSLVDNLPLTGVEAQACGCPVVTFDAAGMRELVEHRRSGWIAAAGSASALAEGIAWVLAEGARDGAVRAQARQRAEALWSPAAIAEAHRAVYAAAVAARTDPPR